MSAVYNENLRLPTWNPTLGPDRPIPNIQASQDGFIDGKPGPENAFNRAFCDHFYVPKRKDIPICVTTDLKFGNNPRFKEADYVTKVEKDAVAAFITVEKEKTRLAYFDELDEGNLFPQKGRYINLPRSIAVQVNSDGSTSAFHQPSWLRAQMNQTLGNTTKKVERATDPRSPETANAKEKNVILGQNCTVNITNSGTQMSFEVGRIGSMNKVEVQSHATSPILFPSDSVTKDFGSPKTDKKGSPMDIDNVKYPPPSGYNLEPMDVKYPSPTKYDPPSQPDSKKITFPKVPKENSDEELRTRTHLLRAPSTGPWSKNVIEDEHEARTRMHLLAAPLVPNHDPNLGWWRGGGSPSSSSSGPSSPGSPGVSPKRVLPTSIAARKGMLDPRVSIPGEYPHSPITFSSNTSTPRASIPGPVATAPQMTSPHTAWTHFVPPAPGSGKFSTPVVANPERYTPYPRRSTRVKNEVNYKEPDRRSNKSYVKKK